MKWINKFLNYILFFTALTCVSIFGYVYSVYSEQKKIQIQKTAAQQQPSAEELVNKYMKQGALDLQREQLESLTKMKSNLGSEKNKPVAVKEIPPEQIPIELQIAKDQSSATEQTLTEEFNQKYFQSQVQQKEDERSREEYAKEFIENARKNGYHITLSEDLQVTSVRPIRKPTSQQNDLDVFESQPSH